MHIEADIERTKQAREATRQKRLAAGLPTDDLDAITDTKITQAAHYQQGELHQVGKSQRSPIAGAPDADIDDALSSLDEAPEKSKPAPKSTPKAPPAPKATPKPGRMTKVLTKLGKASKMAAKAIPFAGAAVGHASAAHAASQGDYTTAALDEAGMVPVAGDLLDMGRAGWELGGALDEGLGISEVAAEDGMAAQNAAKALGASEDTAVIVGAVTAGVSSITVAPTRAAARRAKDLWNYVWD
jgi:hypothetical protein